MVIRRAELILAFLVSKNLKSPVGNYLVGVHVNGCSGAALHHVHRELVMELAVNNLAAGLYNGVCNLRIHRAKLLVRLRGGQLDTGHGDDILRVVAHSGIGNLIVVDSPLCLHTVIGLNRNLKFAKKVRFNSEFLFAHNELILSY